MGGQAIDTNTSRIGRGPVEVDKAVGKSQFGGELEKLKKLLEPDAIFYCEIHSARAESAVADVLFPANVCFDTERAPGQQIHSRVVASFGLVLQQNGEIEPGRFADFGFRAAARIIVVNLAAEQRHGGGYPQVEAVVDIRVHDEAYAETAFVGRIDSVGRIGRDEGRAVANTEARDRNGEKETVVNRFGIVAFEVLHYIFVVALCCCLNVKQQDETSGNYRFWPM